MDKTITVRKSKGERCAARMFFLLFLIAAVICAVAIKDGKLYAVLAWCVVLIPFLIFVFYLETWRISFGEKICKKAVLFSRIYEWCELSETKKYYSLSSGGEKVVLTFKCGKSLSFTCKDENSEKAEKIILKHCNIKTQ